MGYVYFAKSEHGPVKIGYSKDPEKRVSDAMSFIPGKLRLVFYRGTRHHESALHQLFSDIRIDGGGREWFHLAHALACEPKMPSTLAALSAPKPKPKSARARTVSSQARRDPMRMYKIVNWQVVPVS